jgi:hypothetical protein
MFVTSEIITTRRGSHRGDRVLIAETSGTGKFHRREHFIAKMATLRKPVFETSGHQVTIR